MEKTQEFSLGDELASGGLLHCMLLPCMEGFMHWLCILLHNLHRWQALSSCSCMKSALTARGWQAKNKKKENKFVYAITNEKRR